MIIIPPVISTVNLPPIPDEERGWTLPFVLAISMIVAVVSIVYALIYFKVGEV